MKPRFIKPESPDKITPILNTTSQSVGDGFTWEEYSELLNGLRAYKPVRKQEDQDVKKIYIPDLVLSTAIRLVCNDANISVKNVMKIACQEHKQSFDPLWQAGNIIHAEDMILRSVYDNKELLESCNVNLIVLCHESVSRFRPRALLNNLRSQIKLIKEHKDRIEQLELENADLRSKLSQILVDIDDKSSKMRIMLRLGYSPEDIQQKLDWTSGKYYRELNKLRGS